MANEDPAFGGSGTGDAISAAAEAIAGIKSDMSSIARDAKSVAGSMANVSQASVQGSSGGFSARDVAGGKATGFAEDQGLRLGSISGVGAAGRLFGMKGAAIFGGAALAGGALKLGMAGYNDLRVGADNAMWYERQRMTGMALSAVDYDKFQGIVDEATTSFFVQDQQALVEQIARNQQQSGGAMFGGGTVGARRSAMTTGMMNQLATLGGFDPSIAGAAYSQIYSAPSYYRAMAGGIMTRNPVTGERYDLAQITNQFFNRNNLAAASVEELERALAPEAALMLELRQNYGEEGAQIIRQGILARAATGQPLTMESLNQQLEEAGITGTEYTQGAESQSGREASRIGQIGEYALDVTEGVEMVNDAFSTLYDTLSDLEGPLRDIVGGLETFGGAVDTFSTLAPRVTGAIEGALNGLSGALGAFLTTGVVGWLLKKAGVNIPGLKKGGTSGGAGSAAPKSRGSGPSSPVRPGSPGTGGFNARGIKGLSAITAAIEGWSIYRDIQDEGFVRGLFGDWFGLTENVQEYGLWEGLRRSADTPYSNQKYGEGRSKGDWFVEKDQVSKIHQGEMVVPARIATAVREELDMGVVSPIGGGRGAKHVEVNINLTIQRATDVEATRFARRVKGIIDNDAELMAIGRGRF